MRLLEILGLLLATCAVKCFADCVYSNIGSCRLVDPEDHCRCPCLPKCCPEGHILRRGHSYHGLECIAHEEELTLSTSTSTPTDKKSKIPLLPDVPIFGDLSRRLNLTSSSKLRFYHSLFPKCDGIEQADWQYNVHWQHEFWLNADYQQEYVLHINPNAKEYGKRDRNRGFMQMISNFENHGERDHAIPPASDTNIDAGTNGADYDIGLSDTVVGFKPLMYFCFDQMKAPATFPFLSEVETVAVTCPRPTLTTNKKIHKCCPPGYTYSDPSLKSCSESPKNRSWMLPINGHLYSEQELENQGVLVYDKNKSLILPDVRRRCNSKIGFKQYEETDSFHIGPDARMHFTDTHMNIIPMDDYCVDQLYVEPVEYEYDNDFGSDDRDEDNYYAYDYGTLDNFEDDESYYYLQDQRKVDNLNKMKNYNCHNKENKPQSMVAFYCKDEILQLRKCCDQGQNLNLRSRACTHDLARDWEDPKVYQYDEMSLTYKETTVKHINRLYLNIPNMKKEHLYVSDENFKLLLNGSLYFEGKTYNSSNYCLDYAINYCSNKPSVNLRAIINDERLASVLASTIFGTNKEDSEWSLWIKRFGYPTSIFFLLLTLVAFLVVSELRQDLHGKMVISIVFSQMIVFICLTIGTFPSVSVSKFNAYCVSQALITYYCILCSFCWLSTMSYNIMSKFRASTILPKEADYQRFTIYSFFCFGFPMFLSLLVWLCNQHDLIGSFWRPGFGEESCWFTSCSSALSIFLYCPISLLLTSNIWMFSFAAYKLYRMRSRAKNSGSFTCTGQQSSFLRSSDSKGGMGEDTVNRSLSVYGYRGADEEEDVIYKADEKIREKFIRQISSVSSSMGKRKRKYKSNRESFSTYLKLFVAMGLNWSLEILAWILSDDDKPAPEIIIVFLNVFNIFQGLIIFLVFTLKPSTAKKLRLRLRIGSSNVFTNSKHGQSSKRHNSMQTRRYLTSSSAGASTNSEVNSFPYPSVVDFSLVNLDDDL